MACLPHPIALIVLVMLLISVLMISIALMPSTGRLEQVADEILHPGRQRRQAVGEISLHSSPVLGVREDRAKPLADAIQIL